MKAIKTKIYLIILLMLTIAGIFIGIFSIQDNTFTVSADDSSWTLYNDVITCYNTDNRYYKQNITVKLNKKTTNFNTKGEITVSYSENDHNGPLDWLWRIEGHTIVRLERKKDNGWEAVNEKELAHLFIGNDGSYEHNDDWKCISSETCPQSGGSETSSGYLTMSTGTTEGTYRVYVYTHYYYANAHATQDGAYSEEFYLDGTDPTLTSSATSGGTYNTSNSISLTAKDAFTGVSTIYRRFHKSRFVDCSTSDVNLNTTGLTIDKDYEDGYYSFMAVDNASNKSSQFYICVDKTKPKITITNNSGTAISVPSGSKTKVDYFVVNASDATSEISKFEYSIDNGTTWTSIDGTSLKITGDPPITDKKYIFRCYDAANNKSDDYTIIYDKSPPVLAPYSLNGTTTSSSFTVQGDSNTKDIRKIYYLRRSSSFSTSVITPNTTGVVVTYETSITVRASDFSDGYYSFIAEDDVGNVSTQNYNVCFDTTAPKLSCAVLNNGATNGSFTVYANDATSGIASFQYSKNNGNWINGAGTSIEITNNVDNEGTYKFRCYDNAGKVSDIYTVTLDLTPPTLSSTVANNSNSSSSFSVSGIDNDSVVRIFYLRKDGSFSTSAITPTTANVVSVNGSSLTISAPEYEDGYYSFICIDRAGNAALKNYNICFDTTKPFITSSIQNNGITTTAFTVKPNDKTSGISTLQYSKNNGTWISVELDPNGEYKINSALGEGSYAFRCYDNAGLISPIYRIVYDTSAPTIVGSVSPIIIDGKEYVKAGNSFTISVSDEVSGLASLSYVYTDPNGERFEKFGDVDGQKTGSITITSAAIGEYVFTVVEKAGRSSSYTVCADGTAPTIKFTSSKNLVSLFNNIQATNGNLTIASNTGGDIIGNDKKANIFYSYSDVSFPTSATIQTDDTYCTEQGYYFFSVQDFVGNISTYKILIWKETAEIMQNGYAVNGTQYFNTLNSSINLSYNAYCHFLTYTPQITKNGSPYDMYSLTDEGTYIYSVIDNLGNTATATIIISNKYPDYRYFSLINNYYVTSDTSGTSYIFSSYDTAYSVAVNRERSKVEFQGLYADIAVNNYSIFPTDFYTLTQAGITDFNNLDCVYYRGYVYFYNATNNFEAAISANAKGSVSDINLMTATSAQKAYEVYEGQQAYKFYNGTYLYYSRSSVTLSRQTNCTIKVNGELVTTATTISVGGLYEITETTLAGLSIRYYILIDKDAPTMFTVTYPSFVQNTEYFMSGTQTFYFGDAENDFNAGIMYSYTYSYGSDPIYGVGTSLTLSESGYYVITLKDTAGNTAVYYIYIMPNDNPEDYLQISYSETAGIKTSMEATIDCGDLNSIRAITVTLDDSLIDSDRNGATINSSTLSYSFDVTGTYIFTLQDYYGRTITKTVYFEVGTPTGILTNRDGKILSSGAVTNTSSVQLKWNTALNVTATIIGGNYGADPVEYVMSSRVTLEGTYTITLTSNADTTKFTAYTFTIDRSAPRGTVLTEQGAVLSENAYTNKKIYFTWEENNCTAYYSIGENRYSYTKGELLSTNAKYTFYLYDIANNYSTVTVNYSSDADVINAITGSGTNTNNLRDGEITNKTFYFSWSSSYSTATWNGSSYKSGTKISVEGTHLLTLTNRYGNVSTMTIIIDKTPPVATLYNTDFVEVSPGGTYSSPICLTFSSDISRAIYNDYYNYESGTYFSANGDYSITVFDVAGNGTTYSFTLKLTASVLSIYDKDGTELSVGASTAKAIYATWSDNGCTAFYSLNGGQQIAYTKNSTLKSEGTYIFYLYDAAGSCTTAIVTIDKTPPSGGFYAISSDVVVTDQLVNYSVYFKTTDECTAIFYKDDIEQGAYNSDVIFSEDGTYTIILNDGVGNSTVYTITVDKTAPIGNFYTYSGDVIADEISLINTNFYFSWSDGSCTATYSVNNNLTPAAYTKTSVMRAEGVYVFFLSDKAGNLSSYTITLDKTAPNGAFYDCELGKIIDSEVVGYSVYFDFDADSSAEYWVNDVSMGVYIAGAELTAEGTYTIRTTDAAGNALVKTIIIDKTAPLGAFYSDGNVIIANDVTNKNIYFTWQKTGSSAKYTLNDGDSIAYNKGALLKGEGKYVFTLTDRVGNISTYEITIDKTVPTGVFRFSDLSEVPTTTVNQSVFFDYEDDVESVQYYYNGENMGVYLSEFYLSDPGSYTIELIDAAGNVSVYSIVIDTTAPIGSIYTSNGIEITNNSLPSTSSIYFTWAESGCTAFYSHNNENKVSYSKNAVLRTDGSYTFFLYDTAGNETIYSVKIDTTAPIGILYSNQNIITTNSVISADVYFTWEENDCHAFYSVDNEELSSYIDGSVLTYDGSYTFYLYDTAGNVSTYVVTIDKTAPIGYFYTSTDKLIENSVYVTERFYFTWIEAGCTAYYTLDGGDKIEYAKNSILRKDGKYTFLILDIAGNEAKFSIILDTIAPSGVFYSADDMSELSKSTTNHSVFFMFEENCFVLYYGENGEQDIYNSSIIISEDGFYSFMVRDKAGNEEIYSITIDKTAPNGSLITSSDEEIDTEYTNESFYFTWEEDGCSAFYTVNEGKQIDYSKNTILKADGDYIFYLQDAAGNITTYSLKLIKTKPVGMLYSVDADQNETEESNGLITNKDVMFDWEDLNYIATISIDGGEISAYNRRSIISGDGTYVITLTDLADNSSIYTFTISRVPPVISAIASDGSAVTDGEIIAKNFYFTWDKTSCTALLNNDRYKSGTLIVKNGDYHISVTDAAGNVTEYSVTIFIQAPIINITTIESNNTVLNKSNVSDSVVISWNDEYTVEVNGTIISKDTTFTELGEYSVVVSDKYGNVSTTVFNIVEDTSFSMLDGSSVATIITAIAVSVLVTVGIIVPIIIGKIKGGKYGTKKGKIR